MAINQVSLFFFPPRWQQHVTDSWMRDARSGGPALVSAVRFEDADGPVVQATEVKAWLAAQGFVAARWGGGYVLEYGQVRSIFGTEKEIEVTVGEVDGEMTDVYCRFTLPKGGLPELDRWAALAVPLSARFGLRLGAEGTAPCGEVEFREAVRQNPNWQDWARQRWGKDKSRGSSAQDVTPS